MKKHGSDGHYFDSREKQTLLFDSLALLIEESLVSIRWLTSNKLSIDQSYNRKSELGFNKAVKANIVAKRVVYIWQPCVHRNTHMSGLCEVLVELDLFTLSAKVFLSQYWSCE